MNDLISVLESFLDRMDWSRDSARQLEEQLDDYLEVDGVQDLQDILASYTPGGGAYLYDQTQLLQAIVVLIESLRNAEGRQ
jgi:hypothetical protein